MKKFNLFTLIILVVIAAFLLFQYREQPQETTTPENSQTQEELNKIENDNSKEAQPEEKVAPVEPAAQPEEKVAPAA